MVFKFRLDKTGDDKYCCVAVFVGPEENQTFQHAGTLRLKKEEWSALGSALIANAQEQLDQLKVVVI